MKVKISNANIPSWKEVTVKSRIPDELKKLAELSRNMWWAWNHEATDLFKSLNPDLWKEVGQNPVLLLERLSYEQLEQLAQDKVILKRMDAVYDNFSEYMSVKPDKSRPSVAYFCMEYGLNHVLKLYSGGLGILAGDYMKEASDSNVDMCGIGLLYRHGYFTQTLSMDGQQIANYETQNFGSLPIERVMDKDGQPLVVKVPYMNYWVYAYIWRVNIGRVPLYLMDTDNEMNSEFDRPITSQLYGGDWENRLKQEILLGIGGMLTLEALGIEKDVYHCNEGHAALCNLKRLCDFVEKGLTFEQALRSREFEPDGPNYTPRISGIMQVEDGTYHYALSILKSNNGNPDSCCRYTFTYENPVPGEGHFIHTYMHDGDPLPSFEGEPKLVKIPNDMEAFATDLWDSLNEDNKVSLFVRYIDIKTGKYETKIINKNQ